MVTNKNIYPLMEDVMEDLACTVAKINKEVKLLAHAGSGWTMVHRDASGNLSDLLKVLVRYQQELDVLNQRLRSSDEAFEGMTRMADDMMRMAYP